MTDRTMRWDAVAVAAAIAVLVAAVGSTLTDLGPWYQNLKQPSWKLPDAAFGVVWTVIFALAALSGSLAWRASSEPAWRQLVIGLFALNGFLNVLWSLLFFRLQRPDWALIEVGLFWLSILALIVVIGRRSRLAAALLAPYLAWVALAAVLNQQVVALNGPFG